MKTRTTATRLGIAAALGAGLLLAPVTAAHAEDTTPSAPTAAGSCEVTGGTLNWGLLERWRAYISGAIANGSYEPIAPATYNVPEFSWSDPTGSIDPETGAGEVSFAGGMHFMGHNGALDSQLTNPTFVFNADGTAQLLLDVNSRGRDGAPDMVETAVPLADLGSVGVIDTSAGSYSLTGAASVLTEAGSAVFTAYDPGQPLDPITLNFTFDCAEPEPAVDEAADEPGDTDEEIVATPISAPVDEATVPWVPIIVGAVVVVAAGVIIGAVAANRKKRGGSAAAGGGSNSSGDSGESAS